jgi:CDP-diacylglycerol--glycerol-3-phosphate 3-phosphatidyltransferase
MAISVYQLKTKFQGILRPFTGFLAKIGVSANGVTVSAFVLSVLSGAAIGFLFEKTPLVLLILPIILFIRMALNAIDGMLAREFDQKSNLGAILNELGDMLSDIAIYIPFLWVLEIDSRLIMAIALLSLLSETCGIMGIQIGASRRYDGPMGKSDRAFWFALLAFVLAFKPDFAQYAVIFSYFVIFFLIITVFNRIKNALKE